MLAVAWWFGPLAAIVGLMLLIVMLDWFDGESD
jgi:hypothetical protein